MNTLPFPHQKSVRKHVYIYIKDERFRALQTTVEGMDYHKLKKSTQSKANHFDMFIVFVYSDNNYRYRVEVNYSSEIDQ